MAWYMNHYHCEECGCSWDDEWSCCCDDECPSCGSGDWSPEDSDDLTFLIVKEEGGYELTYSPPTAGHYPDYEIVGTFPTMCLALAVQHALDGTAVVDV